MSLKDPCLAIAFGLGGLALLVIALTLLSTWSSSAQVLRQGDANCDQVIDARDALADLRFAANILPFADCTAVTGDVDCDGTIDAEDAIQIVKYVEGLPTSTEAPGSLDGACPAIGAPIGTTTLTVSPTTTVSSVTPTPTNTAAGSFTPTPTPGPTPSTTVSPGACAGPGGGPTLPSAPGPTSPPSAGAYGVTAVLTTSYLGDAANAAIALALVPGRPNEAVIADQDGKIYHVFLDNSGQPTLWGNVSSLVTDSGEQGLLSLAFSPNYQQDCRVYLYYTEGSPSPSDLARFTATPEGGLNFGSKEILLQVEQPYANHNGGHIVFGNDGDLYLSLGDGGSENDPDHEGQNMATDLSKIIRIDVSGQTGYSVPPDNPFVGQSGVKPEIYALGFRNPFRTSVDPVTGGLWVGDVGQDTWEEVDRVVKGGNYGWSCYEGFVQFLNYNDPENSCPGKTFQSPRAVYGHMDSNEDVIGGIIYRGTAMRELYGYYLYADFNSGNMWAVNPNDNSPAVQIISHDGLNISDFVLAANGVAYLMTYSTGLYELSR